MVALQITKYLISNVLSTKPLLARDVSISGHDPYKNTVHASTIITTSTAPLTDIFTFSSIMISIMCGNFV